MLRWVELRCVDFSLGWKFADTFQVVFRIFFLAAFILLCTKSLLCKISPFLLCNDILQWYVSCTVGLEKVFLNNVIQRKAKTGRSRLYDTLPYLVNIGHMYKTNDLKSTIFHILRYFLFLEIDSIRCCPFYRRKRCTLVNSVVVPVHLTFTNDSIRTL